MKNNHSIIYRTLQLLCLLLCLQALMACAKIGDASVNIHAVNYTENEFSYWLEEPANPKNHGGGELVDSYSAGGTLCCYELPRRWKPGIKVEIHITRWLEQKPDGSLPEIKETHLAEVPEYAFGKPGELWVIRNSDGSFGLVSSDYQPDHARWPGKVKGWPVPSVAYQRKQWDLYIEHEEGGVRTARKLIQELEQNPRKRAAEAWEFMRDQLSHSNPKYDEVAKAEADLLARFHGASDPAFIEWLRQDYANFLQVSEQKVAKLKASRP